MSLSYVSMMLSLLSLALVHPCTSFFTPGGTSNLVSRGMTAASVPRSSARTSRSMAKSEPDVDLGDPEKGENAKTKAPSWMFNDKGVAYAPWMVDAFDPENLAKTAAAIEARKKKEAETVPEALGDLARDPQQMELSGSGVRAKRVGDAVELVWSTGDESNNVGFVVSRRAAKTEDWVEIASYKTFAPLNSKGPEGGRYSFVDEDVPEGSWVYRISDISKSGDKNDLCQTLIELQTDSEALQTKIGLAGLVIAFLAVIALGSTYDPLQ